MQQKIGEIIWDSGAHLGALEKREVVLNVIQSNVAAKRGRGRGGGAGGNILKPTQEKYQPGNSLLIAGN